MPNRRINAGADEARTPRYLQIAQELMDAIASGKFPIGSQIPTEAEVCQSAGVSRFTAREAIRVLTNKGLVVPRKRAGTSVIAVPDASRHVLVLSSIRDLHQYAQDTELRLIEIDRVTPAPELAAELGLPLGEEWVHAVGIRSDSKAAEPFCVTHTYLNPVLTDIAKKLRNRGMAIYELLEREYGVRIERVEQELRGESLEAPDAARMGVSESHPVLRIIRRYFDRDGRLLEVADNYHLSNRFSYRMQLTS